MRIVPWLITGFGCIGVTAALAGIKYTQIQSAMAMAASFPPPSQVVASTLVEAKEWTPIRRLTGSVRAPQFVTIAAEASGRIVALPHTAGDEVSADDVLLQLFDADLKAQRDAISADLQLADTQLQRLRTLKRDALASQDQLDTLLARIQSLRAQVNALDAQISRLTVRAPFSGHLGIYAQSVGDIMQTGEVLTTLTGSTPQRWVDFKVPQGLAEVAIGDQVRLVGLDGRLLGTARVIAVSNAYNRGLRAYDVRAVTEQPELRHGELLQVEIQTGQRTTAMVVPNHAVRWDVEGPHVFVLLPAPEGTHTPLIAERRSVALLDERDGVALLSGDIAPGDTIATAGAFKLADASAVRVNNSGRELGR